MKIVVEFRQRVEGVPYDTRVIRTPTTSNWDSSEIAVEEVEKVWGITVSWCLSVPQPLAESDRDFFGAPESVRILESVAAMSLDEYLDELDGLVRGIWVDGKLWFPTGRTDPAVREITERMTLRSPARAAGRATPRHASGEGDWEA